MGIHDHVIHAMGLGGRARAVVAETTEAVEELRRLHDPSPEVTAAVGRIATGALLLASTLEKITGREPLLTVEVDGGGPAGRLVATASPAGWVRAMASNPLATANRRDNGKLEVSAVVGIDGQLVVTRDPGIGEPYRGVVDLVSGELAKDLAYYLSESEQSPAAVVLGVKCLKEGRVASAGGLLVQLLPGVSDKEAIALTDRIRAIVPCLRASPPATGLVSGWRRSSPAAVRSSAKFLHVFSADARWNGSKGPSSCSGWMRSVPCSKMEAMADPT